MACRILILGDSSSSDIGAGHACYPRKIFKILKESFPVEVVNCAVPGMTSADANHFFHTNIASMVLDYLVIYLGNNEGAYSSPKGHTSRFTIRKKARSHRAAKAHMHAILSPARFQFNYNIPSKSVATTPEEFRKNLASISHFALKKGIRVILINPIANSRFPAGVGADNHTYLCLLDETREIGDTASHQPVDESSEALALGVRYFLVGDWEQAIEAWECLLAREDAAGFIARHNTVCAMAENGHPTAERMLSSLLGGYDIYDSTILYNLSQLERRKGNWSEEKALLRRAMEADWCLYRVRVPYRAAISSFQGTDGVSIVDLAEVLEPANFVDYCHPDEEGHARIVQALLPHLVRPAWCGFKSERSRYARWLPSPDYVSGAGEFLIDYYGIDWPVPQEKIKETVSSRQRFAEPGDGADAFLKECIGNFFLRIGEHPMFTEVADLTGTWLPRSNEIFSFPEFLSYRILHNYMLTFEASGLLDSLSCRPLLMDILLTSADYARMIIQREKMPLITPIDTRMEYGESVFKQIKNRLLNCEVLYTVSIGERIRTIMTWYTREAFRYGPQSRLSMLFHVTEFDKIIESAVSYAVIADHNDDVRRFKMIDALLAKILQLRIIHEQHVGKYHYYRSSFSVEEYRLDLNYQRQEIVHFLQHEARGI